MKQKHAYFALAAALVVLMAGCASPQRGQDLSNLPEPKNPTEAAQRVVAYAAGFCKGMAEKHGADFETCFKQQTDLAMAKIEAEATSRAAQAGQTE
ncbi:hypothetical protein HX878_20615 [Pseudomonas veronii]|uniref:hypothetical protein n=1 Tax=Pseudomonas veronii TaxID=76761 RepID=UPI0015A0E752|nr:hypothetical protein [Pseudomonas veronii]NWD57137.1 hypothetical protein [Pseudomonas veronii]